MLSKDLNISLHGTYKENVLLQFCKAFPQSLHSKDFLVKPQLAKKQLHPEIFQLTLFYYISVHMHTQNHLKLRLFSLRKGFYYQLTSRIE